MKLISCHIDAFGKLNNVNITFGDGINSICEKNGYGKTTLAMFLKAMFYGLGANARKNSKLTDRTQYLPFSSQGKYGGSLTFVCDKGKFLVRRVFNRTPTLDEFYLYDAENNLPSKVFSQNLGEELFGIGKETFDATVFFGQNHLESEVNDDIKASLSTGQLYGDDLDALSHAVDKIKMKKRDIKSTLKNINLNEEQRALNELYLKEKDYLNKIEKSKADADEWKNKKEYYQNLKDNMDAKKEDFESLNNKKGALEIYINERKKEISKVEDEPLKEVAKKNNPIFIIISIVLLCLSIGVLALYFVYNHILLIFGFAVLLISGIMLLIFHFIRKNRKKQTQITKKTEKNVIFDEILLQKQNELKNLEDEIVKLLGGSESNFVNDYENILKNISTYEHGVITSQNDIKHYQEEYSLLQSKIQEQTDKFQENKELFEKLSNDFTILEKTEESLLASSNKLSKRYVEPVQKAFDNYYKNFLTNDNLIIDSNLNLLMKDNLFNEEYLSAGVKDLVQISKRFALIDLIFKNERPFIVLDDPFVNLDDKNLEVATNIIKEISKKYQILFLTCHSSRKI